MKPKILVVGFLLLASCAAHRPVFDPKFITDNEVFERDLVECRNVARNGGIDPVTGAVIVAGAGTAVGIVAAQAAIAAAPEVFRIGEIEVRVYKDRSKLVADLPPLMRAVNGTGATKVLGFYDRQKNVLYTVEDIRVLLHELKHHLEPEWKHDIECAALPCR